MYVEYHGDENEETVLEASIETQVGARFVLGEKQRRLRLHTQLVF